MSVQPGIGLSFNYLPRITQHIQQENPSSWENLHQIFARTELYMTTIARSRAGGGVVDVLFAGANNMAVNELIELLQVIHLGAKFHEGSGESFQIGQLQYYAVDGAILRMIMQATIRDADYAQSPLAAVAKDPVHADRTFPKIDLDKLGKIPRPESFSITKMMDFLSREFGPIAPDISRGIFKAFGVKGPSSRLSRRREPA